MATVNRTDLNPQLDALVDGVIAAYENNDAAGYLKLFAPGGTVWLSYLGGEQSAADNAALLTEIYRTFVAEFRYENMTRQQTATGYVQQYDLTIIAKSGASFTTPACTVAQVNADGLIERLAEYLDSSMMAFAQAQQPAPTSV